MIVKQKKMDKRINYKLNLDTIFASASSIGMSAIKTVRVSGGAAKKIFKVLTKKKLPKARYSNLFNLYDIKNSSLIDKAIVVWYPEAKTYTGEDMLEINIHGGSSVLEHLIENLLLIKNVREANPGEFTKRAFRNNKIDFLEAEGIMDLINAETKFQKSLAIHQVNGSLSTIFKKWNKKLLKLLAHYESQIDFPEDEVPKNTQDKVILQVADLIKEIEFFLSENKRGDIIRQGIEIAIIGKPNVGKSSLINSLLNRKKLVKTSQTPGKTQEINFFNINNDFIFADLPGYGFAKVPQSVQ